MFADLQRRETRVIKNCVFFNQESEGTVSYILSVKWLSSCSEVGGHEVCQNRSHPVTLFYGTELSYRYYGTVKNMSLATIQVVKVQSG